MWELIVDILFAWFMLIVGLVIILVGCDVFTNSIEWLGKKLDLNEGVLGSIFAAVGTALPETLIPVVAVLFAASGDGGHAEEVGIGAIIGAPFMLGTVAMFVTGLAATIFFRKGRRTSTELRVNTKILSRDIRFFLLAFAVALVAGFIEDKTTKIVIAISMIFYYAFYVYKHATDAEPDTTEEDAEVISPLHFSRNSPEPGMPIVVLQVFFGLAMIIGAAYLFVENVRPVAQSLGVSSLILSLIIVPLATELPEKFNSVIWIRRSKDTLALGNITGAMVFQSTLPVAFGLSFTEWRANAEFAPAFAQAAIAIVAAGILYMSMMRNGKLTSRALMLSGIGYIVWIILVFPLDLEHMVSNWGVFK